MSNYDNNRYTPDYHYPQYGGYVTPPQYNFQTSYETPDADNLSLASLICGVIGLLLCSLILSIMAIAFSCAYYKNHDRMHCGQSKGGMVCGVIGIVLSVVFTLVIFCILIFK